MVRREQGRADEPHSEANGARFGGFCGVCAAPPRAESRGAGRGQRQPLPPQRYVSYSLPVEVESKGGVRYRATR